VIGYGQNGYGFGILDDGTLCFSQVGIGGVSPVEPYLKVNDTGWHYVAATSDGSNVVFWVDGVAGAPLAYAPGFQFATDLAIGGRADTLGNSFWGSIDEPVIFSRALAPGEMAALFASGADGMCKPALFQIAPLQNQTAYPGLACALNVAAYSSASPLSYQWQKEGVNLDGATNASFIISNAQSTSAGNYAVVVSDSINTATSKVAVVTFAVCGAMPSGLAGWWSGDGHAFDLTGNHNGVFQNGATYAAGWVGQAFSLDGGSQYVDLGSWNVGSRAWTWSAWVNPSATPGGRRTIAGGVNQCADWAINMQDGVFGLGIRPPGSCTQTIFSGINAVPGTWYQVVGVCDGYMAKIYVNGQLCAESAVDTGYWGTAAGTRIGGESCCGGNNFPGLIDEVLLFNRPLNSDEIAGLYAAGSAGQLKALQIFVQPQSLTTNVTQAAAVGVIASGTGLLQYQWWKEITNAMDGATNNPLILNNLQLSDAGLYSVVVSDDFGSITSSVAALNLIPPPVIQGFTPSVVVTGNVVNLTGAYLAGVLQAQIGGANASFVLNSDSNLWIYVPSGATNGFISVTTLSGTASSPGALSLSGVPACLAAPDGLVGWWSGEGSADDLVGTNQGNLMEGADFAPGMVGQAFNLDGEEDYVQIPTSSSLSITGAITVEGWINPQRLQGTIASQWDSSREQCAWWFGVGPSGEVYFQVSADGCAWRSVVTGSGQITPGVFAHVAGTFDPAAQELKVYVNGLSVPVFLQTGSATVAAIHHSTAPICLGAYIEGNGQLDRNWMFAGLLDEISLYNRALAPDEIEAIFNANSAGKCKPVDTNAPAVLAVGPDYGRVGLLTNTPLIVTFSETMDARTLTGGTFFVTDPSGNPVPGTIAYDLANRTAAFAPLAGYADGTNTLTITTGVKDLDGNGLATNFTWNFRVNAAALMITNSLLIDVGDTTYDGLDLIINDCTVILNGDHAFNNLLVINSGALDVTGGTTLGVAQDLAVRGHSTILCQGANNTGLVNGQWAGVGVTINASNVWVEAGSTFFADGQGYWTGAGPGAGGASSWASGAGYGGSGGVSANGTLGGTNYGSMQAPVDLGSGGAQGDSGWGLCTGGGAIALSVAGTLTVDGSLSANGNSSPTWNCGGGSGGSLYLQVGTLMGSGVISANGGSGNGAAGGGGGGRIAVYGAANTFAGTLSAHGAQHGGWGGWGASTAAGGPGTIFTQATQGSTAAVQIDNGGLNGPALSLDLPGIVDFKASGNAVVQLSSSVTLNSLLTDSGAGVSLLGGQTNLLAVQNGVLLCGGSTLSVPAWTTFTAGDAIHVNSASTLTLGGGTVLTVGDLNVVSNSTVLCEGANNTDQVSNQWMGVGVTINASNVLVEAGSEITADDQGYVASTGNGVGLGGPAEFGWGNGGGGGGYGGAGGTAAGWVNSGGSAYGSVLEPVDLGSSASSYVGNWSGSGGGAIRLVVSGTFDLEGVVSANGGVPAAHHSGGGSGGSLWVWGLLD